MPRFYANENFPLPVVDELRRLGHDVLTTDEAGNAGRGVPDEDVLALAHNDRRILLTFNRRHFVRLHERGADHSGIVACTFDPAFSALAHRIHDVLEPLGDCAGRLIRVNRPG